MSNATPIALPWHRREDTWAIFIALGLVLAVTTGFFLGASPFVGATALTIPTWSGSLAKVTATFAAQPAGPIALFAVFLLAFSAASAVIGWDVGKYAAGFALLFVFSIVVTVLGSNQTLKQWQLETPLLALAVGMLLGNSVALPGWFQSALRTEFYVKVGIILLGATLPFTIILQAGPLAIAQATIVAVITFATIYFAATRLFGLDPRFGATLGAGGFDLRSLGGHRHRRGLPRGEEPCLGGDLDGDPLGGRHDLRAPVLGAVPRPRARRGRRVDRDVRVRRRGRLRGGLRRRGRTRGQDLHAHEGRRTGHVRGRLGARRRAPLRHDLGQEEVGRGRAGRRGRDLAPVPQVHPRASWPRPWS